MSDTVFVNGVTLTDAEWFQDVNDPTYDEVANVKNSAYGAEGDGITNDGAAIASAIAGFTVVAFPYATYLTSALTAALTSKVIGNGSLLKPSANSMTVLTFTAGLDLQSGDFQLVRDLRIDGSAHTGITGFKAASGTNCSLILENLYALSCDTVAFDLQNSQFVRSYGLRATTGNGTGMLIRNVAITGGGNSHNHFSTHLCNKEVGLVVNGTNLSGGVYGLNFYNPEVAGNTVCGMAFFTADAVIYGGAPESNASGAATVTVDGLTVKKSSMYLNASKVRVIGQYVVEASASPCFLLETGSVLTLEDVQGYGSSLGLLVQADASSTVHLKGIFSCTGIVQNVASWPDAFILPSTAQSNLYGEPVLSIDRTIAPLFAEQASAWVSTAGAHPPISNAFAEDADLGYCRSVQYDVFAGDTNGSNVQIAIASFAASKDTIVSLLVKASVDCTLGYTTFNGSTFHDLRNESIVLKAGKVTRLIAGKRSIASGTFTIYVYPMDTAGATVKFSNLQLYQGDTGTWGTTQDIAKIIKLGAFWPGVTRDTQTNLRDKTASVNARGKFPGKQVWDTTNNRVVFAAGQAITNVWIDGVTATVHTPV